MPKSLKKLCKEQGLHYVQSCDLNVRRRRCGKGFIYVDQQGTTIREERAKSRFRSLAIPPAWTDVRIAEDPRAHLQAVGRDSEGRLQYCYHAGWERLRAATKERRLLRIGRGLPRLRRLVRKSLRSSLLTRETVTAAVVRLIDRTLLRAGHEKYSTTGGGRGAATLLKSDVDLDGETVVLDFKGKGGTTIHHEVVRDSLLAGVLRRLKQLPGRRLFKVPDEKGDLQPVTAQDVNSYLVKRPLPPWACLPSNKGLRSAIRTSDSSKPLITPVSCFSTREPSPCRATFTQRSCMHTNPVS